MRNCLIVGFGRSGTSLLAGILNTAGYYSGDDLYPPRSSNPKGFFESAKINHINELLLEPYDFHLQAKQYPVYQAEYSPYRPRKGHRWLSYISEFTEVETSDEYLLSAIQGFTQQSPYCYKDPRFAYTLPVWNSFLNKRAVILVVFRHPSVTVNSVIKECATVKYLEQFYIDYPLAFKLWENYYKRVLWLIKRIANRKFVFIHYLQIINGDFLHKLQNELEVFLDSSFVDQSLLRSKDDITPPEQVIHLYKFLCQIAEYKDVE